MCFYRRVDKHLFAFPPIMPIPRGQTIKPFAHLPDCCGSDELDLE